MLFFRKRWHHSFRFVISINFIVQSKIIVKRFKILILYTFKMENFQTADGSTAPSTFGSTSQNIKNSDKIEGVLIRCTAERYY
jgi:hypothetical protein